MKNVLLTALLFLPAAAVRAQSAASDQKGATPVADDATAPRPVRAASDQFKPNHVRAALSSP